MGAGVVGVTALAGGLLHGSIHADAGLIALGALAFLLLVPVAGFTITQIRVFDKGILLARTIEDAQAISATCTDAYATLFLAIRGVTAPPSQSRTRAAVRAPSREPAALDTPAPEEGAEDDDGEGEHAEAYPEGSFLAGLTAGQRKALLTAGRPCAYDGGEVLFREGQRAVQVIVILHGTVRVTVTRRGVVTVLASRGPGDLVGERAVSRLRARSATVTAYEPLRGVRLGAAEFLDLLNHHPAMLDVLERQLFARMTEAGPAPRLSGQNCSVLMADIVGFGDHRRTDADRSAVVDALYEAMEDVFEESGIAWEQCHDEDRGDGMLLVVPVAVPTARVVEPMTGLLAGRLRAYNAGATRARRLGLRMALDVGPVSENGHGVEGEAIINTARLIAAEPLTQGVARPGVDLGLIASRFVYDSVIRHQAEAAAYLPVDVRVKTYADRGWLRFYGAANRPTPGPGGARARSVRGGPGRTGPSRTRS